ncbi:hypothetical protein KR51_00016640 [Rubidibacter lacunae KORDI 51-2]|uniref:DUF445 domain-containing protein n=1 Tax=Rubidibacter lacunae KORDI 51-2 TaxID=582515 RepID=U5DJE2_9CHRO|nr:DUF445 family protein [Rubidibacter lacunae]ERN41811.1 hypothetical protein KR51_00016640 [Rubidibacter lacunae KORDI 51-2]
MQRALELAVILKFALPPVAGAVIGYFTNSIAIKMLFYPYSPVFIGKRRLPFTPGLIPRNQERLAQRVADTIMGSLLTPSELQKLARRLLQPERVEAAILWLLQSSLKQLEGDRETKTARLLAQVLRDLTGGSLPRLIGVLARRDDFLKTQIDRIFDRVLLEFQFSELQARQLADWILQVALPPDALRRALVELLTERNIQTIDSTFREKTSGTVWVFANFFSGLQNGLARLRAFCLDEPETANARIEELILTLEVRNRLRDWFQSLSLQSLPVSTVRQLRRTCRESVRGYVQQRGGNVLQGLGETVDWENIALLLVRRLRSSEAVQASLGTVSTELAAILERYLEQDLERIVAQAIPILAIDRVIVDRVIATPPEQLETTVNAIVKNELQAIVNLGGVLGFIVGAMQAGIFFFLSSYSS